ncbi:uncharacterized protein PHACADRAFT_149379 [Phanerochaete carnosa HHB-10118-sp]|uniref:Cysteine-rich protein 1 n=1 Tax=Phanerochaete carnosa (strain HHB-10118-sp) TaxID=650164 RepID=K5W0G0_PHACS|nr:uncharacterized protein PHACADRAFT_149379 [Phanerochaete carnosa HHB-10118-sp]EKM52595.1 hypothetical protein PHACADRAFT_149379 [Phanerochaete carnosa HHB-10118-sp]
MHPFGGTPICPRCSKAVYAAEQIMGPGRKLYHKPCLTCTSCKKRLDSYSLVEHNEEPYCNTCHVKIFGTRDLRHANLPDRDDVFLSPPTSPASVDATLPPIVSPSSAPPPLPPRPASGPYTSPREGATSPVFKPTHTWGQKRASFGAQISLPTTSSSTPPKEKPMELTETKNADADEDWGPPAVTGTPSHAGRGSNGLPRTVPLESTMAGPPRTPGPVKKSITSDGVTSSTPVIGGRMTIPLGPTPTGTRYGAALSGRTASPIAPMTTGRQWGGSNSVCPKCQKTVYFAEQVKAIGRTWHRNCLRCTECGTVLDSSRLTENEGSPYCKHCYGKLHGPAGNGYALLGKAGG